MYFTDTDVERDHPNGWSTAPKHKGAVMKRILLGTTMFAGLLVAGTAQAADLGRPVYKAPPPAYFSWSGCYIGADAGFAWQRDRLHETVRGTNVTSNFSPVDAAKPDGAKLGGYLGCNWQWGGPWVVGIEGDAEFADVGGRANYINTGTPPDFYRAHTDFQGSVRARLGYAVDRSLFYITGGGAWADVKHTYVVGAVPTINESFTKTMGGWTIGAGWEYALAANWIGRVEYRYADFGSVTNLPAVTFTGFTEHHKVTENAIRAGLAYKF
jgi:outer membrane immunogenic protein